MNPNVPLVFLLHKEGKALLYFLPARRAPGRIPRQHLSLLVPGNPLQGCHPPLTPGCCFPGVPASSRLGKGNRKAGFNWEIVHPVWTGPSGVPQYPWVFIPAVPQSGSGKENTFVARGVGGGARGPLALSQLGGFLADVSLSKLGKIVLTRTDAVT